MFFFLAKKPKITVQQIHDEFDSAQERLLNEAKEILQQGKSNKGERLMKIGFINSPIAKNINYQVKTKQEAEVIEYYKQNYPTLKFLTEKELERICKKYNLVFAPIKNYICDVPEKNISEIEGCPNLKHVDVPEDYVIFKCTCDVYGVTDEEKKQIKKGIIIPVSDYVKSDNTSNIKAFYKREGISTEYNSIDYRATIVSRNGLFIAAPKNHFDLSGLDSVSQYGFANTKTIDIPDPIVFRYCKGGVQIITKWGDEASDELVVNEKMN